MYRFSTVLVALSCGASMAAAEGFAVSDLTQFDVDTSAFISDGKGFDALPKARSLMVACLDCDHTAVVNFSLETVAPTELEVESQLREGTMTKAVLSEGCAAAENITCIDADVVEVGMAVGWMTRTKVGEDRHLQTFAIYLDGQKLNVQAIAETRDEADAIGQAALETVVPEIVMGPKVE